MAARKNSRPDPPAHPKRSRSRMKRPVHPIPESVIDAMQAFDTAISVVSSAAQAFERNQSINGHIVWAEAGNADALQTLQVGVKMLRKLHGDLNSAIAKGGVA